MQRLLDHIHNDLIVKAFPLLANVPIEFIYIGGLFVASVLIIVWMSLVAMGWIYLERKVSAYIQVRIGPNRVHPKTSKADPRFNAILAPLSLLNYILPPGWLQSLADGIKLLFKEDIVPTKANRFLYELAPLLVFAGAFIPFVALPFSQHLVIADMDLGLFYILAFGALEVVGILMAGWGPNSKWTLYGGMRLAAQMLSYEIPLGLSVMVIVILAGSLNLTDIILWQTQGVLFWDSVHTWWIFDFLNWGLFRAPWATIPAFIIFYIAGLAETKRAPFDLPEAESELVSGFHTEYTGIRFSYFFLAEYCAMYVICLLGAAIFLGGWHWPLPTTFDVGDSNFIAHIAERVGKHADYVAIAGLTGGDLAKAVGQNVWTVVALLLWHGPLATISALVQPETLKVIFNELFGFLNLVGKSFFLLFVMLWVRWTLPRVRIDQVMHMCLKVMLPFGLACVLLAAIQAAVLTQDKRTEFRPAPAAEVAAAPAGETPAEPAKIDAPAAEAPKADAAPAAEAGAK